MANSLMSPIGGIPSFDELLKMTVEGFKNFGLEPYYLTMGISPISGTNLEESDVYVQEHRNGYFCWLKFYYIKPEWRDISAGDPEYMLATQTRGEKDQYFATIMTYILAKKLSWIIYDDGHLIGDKDSYTIEELLPVAEKAKEFYLKNEFKTTSS